MESAGSRLQNGIIEVSHCRHVSAASNAAAFARNFCTGPQEHVLLWVKRPEVQCVKPRLVPEEPEVIVQEHDLTSHLRQMATDAAEAGGFSCMLLF